MHSYVLDMWQFTILLGNQIKYYTGIKLYKSERKTENIKIKTFEEI
jgi:hypothetical protein